MKRGSSYDSLDSSLRTTIATVMMYYQVDGNNKKFVNILEKVVNDIKEGNRVCNSIDLQEAKKYWDY